MAPAEEGTAGGAATLAQQTVAGAPAAASAPTATNSVAAAGESASAAPVGLPTQPAAEVSATATATVLPATATASATASAIPPTATPTRAATAKRVIALDPGHGGPESGASAYGLEEKDVNLNIALKLAALLRAQGYEPVLTRDTDRSVSPLFTGGGYPGLTYDVQARVDIANAAGADLFISIHNNGGDPGESGTEVWYNRQRTFADRNLALAQLVQDNLLKRIRALGYPAEDRGIKNDDNFRIYRGRPYNIFVLGPGTGARSHVPTQMPGVLGESLFISNADDAAMLQRDDTLDAIAAGYRDAIVAYFERFP